MGTILFLVFVVLLIPFVAALAIVARIQSFGEAGRNRITSPAHPAPCCSKTSVRFQFSETARILLTVQSGSRPVLGGAQMVGGLPCAKNSFLTASSLWLLRALRCFSLACSLSHLPNLQPWRPQHESELGVVRSKSGPTRDCLPDDTRRASQTLRLG